MLNKKRNIINKSYDELHNDNYQKGLENEEKGYRAGRDIVNKKKNLKKRYYNYSMQ